MNNKGVFIIGSPLLSAILVSLIFIVGSHTLTAESVDLPGESVPTIPPQKIDRGKKHPPYLTNPPTSGWYTESNLRSGIFTTPITDEQIVEALTKGTVVITYNCQYGSPTPSPSLQKSDKTSSPSAEKSTNQSASFSPLEKPQQSPQEIKAIWEQVERQNKACGEIVPSLRKIVEKKGPNNIILAPYSKLDTRIALASWGRLDKLLWIDQNRIEKFIDTFRGKKPKF